MSKRRFSPRALRLLKFYFADNLSLSESARLAGFAGGSVQSLCNTGARVLARFYQDPEAAFRQMKAFQARETLAQLRRRLSQEGGIR